MPAAVGDGARGEVFDPAVMAELSPALAKVAHEAGERLSGTTRALTGDEETPMRLEPEDIKAVITRLERANGHLAAVIRMLEDGSECEDALTQLAALNRGDQPGAATHWSPRVWSSAWAEGGRG